MAAFCDLVRYRPWLDSYQRTVMQNTYFHDAALMNLIASAFI